MHDILYALQPFPTPCQDQHFANYSCLPPRTQNAVVSYQRYGQQPLPLIACSALANVSLACQTLANVV
jgi:hypothetical protein